jgi:hypothetical protein
MFLGMDGGWSREVFCGGKILSLDIGVAPSADEAGKMVGYV